MTLTSSIIQTLAYLALFDYAVTIDELHRFLLGNNPCSYQKLKKTIANMPVVRTKKGLISLTDQAFEIRQVKAAHFERKMKYARKAIAFLRYIPFIRAVFVCNQLPVTVREQSDIDIVIITKHGWLWWVRFWAILLMAITRKRIQGTNTKDKICLSFYVTDQALDFSSIALDEDIYLSFWVALLIPMYDPEQLYDVVWKKNYKLRQVFANANKIPIIPSRFVVSRKPTSTRWFEKLFSSMTWLNWSAKQLLFWRIKQKNILDHVGVVINQDMLKFHEHDRRKQFYDQWQQLIRQYE